jgi:hypothetical protein
LELAFPTRRGVARRETCEGRPDADKRGVIGKLEHDETSRLTRGNLHNGVRASTLIIDASISFSTRILFPPVLATLDLSQHRYRSKSNWNKQKLLTSSNPQVRCYRLGILLVRLALPSKSDTIPSRLLRLQPCSRLVSMLRFDGQLAAMIGLS